MMGTRQESNPESSVKCKGVEATTRMCLGSECVGDVDAYPLQSVFRCSLRDPRAFSLESLLVAR
jgi:hypothetical protein